VIPVIDALVKQVPGVFISVDTSKPEVMQAAVHAGASMINDVRALQLDNAIVVAQQLNVPVCLMHMQGQPDTMQQAPGYTDVVSNIKSFLQSRCMACEQAGIPKESICIDPGFGFGKTDAHNLSLIKHLPELVAMGYPVLVGLSRKSMIGRLLQLEVEDRLIASVILATYAMLQGAAIVRVHDVAETVQAVQLLQAIDQAE
jgi:dihydropteroate synthase